MSIDTLDFIYKSFIAVMFIIVATFTIKQMRGGK